MARRRRAVPACLRCSLAATAHCRLCVGVLSESSRPWRHPALARWAARARPWRGAKRIESGFVCSRESRCGYSAGTCAARPPGVRPETPAVRIVASVDCEIAIVWQDVVAFPFLSLKERTLPNLCPSFRSISSRSFPLIRCELPVRALHIKFSTMLLLPLLRLCCANRLALALHPKP